tara:strand:- start:5884 stop:7452 length:1569 start_codon:yes stop_codon:yes gene_type:complete
MANGNIIEAAKAAYTPAKVDISGFVDGLSSIASGIIAKKKKNAAKRNKADSVVFNTKDKRILSLAEQEKDKILNGGDIDEGIDKLKSIAYDVNNVIPKINERIQDIMIKGISGDTDPLLKNYFESIKSGELDAPIEIRDKDGNVTKVNTMFNVTEDGELQMLSPDGTYKSVQVVLDALNNVNTRNNGKVTSDLVAAYINTSHKDLESWKNSSNAFKTKLFNEFKNSPKAKNSFLFDYTFNINEGEEISFVDYYIKNKLYDADDYAAFEEKTKELPDEEREEVKNYFMLEVMQSDTNFDDDVKTFINNITESKKPGGTSGTFVIDRQSNVGAQIGEVDDMFSSMNSEKPYTTLRGNQIALPTEEQIKEHVEAGYEGNVNNLRIITNTEDNNNLPIIFDASDPDKVKQAMRLFFPMYVKDQNISDDYTGYSSLFDSNVNKYLLKTNSDYNSNKKTTSEAQETVEETKEPVFVEDDVEVSVKMNILGSTKKFKKINGEWHLVTFDEKNPRKATPRQLRKIKEQYK